MKKLIAIAAIAAVTFATPAMAGGFGYGNNHGHNSGSLINVDVSDIDVLADAEFLNGIYVGNGANVLSGILNGNTIANGNSLPVLSGNSVTSILGLGIKRRGRW